MAFDREAARQYYSDAEIDQFLGVEKPSIASFQPEPVNDDWLSEHTGGLLTTGTPSGALGGGLESVLQGATLGFSDEIQAGLESMFDYFTDDKPKTYKEARKGITEQYSKYQAEHPVASIAGEMAGGVATGAGLFSAAPKVGASLAPNLTKWAGIHPVLAGMGAGTSLGAVSGAGFAPEIEDIPKYAATGATLGGAIPGAAHLAGKLTKPVVERVGQAFTAARQGPEAQAKRLVSQAAQADLPDLSTLPQTGKLMDAGDNLRRLGQTVYAQGGPGSTLIKEGLEERAEASVPRLAKKLQENIGTDVSAFKASVEITDNMRKQAGPLYKQAYKEFITVDDDLADVFARPIAKTAWNKAKNNTLSDPDWPAGVQFSELPKEGNIIPVAALDWFKKEADSMYISAGKSPSKAGLYKRMSRDVRDWADAQDAPGLQSWKQAREIYTSSKPMTEALDMGARILKDDAEAMADVVSKMATPERKMFMVGALKAIREKLKTTRGKGNAAARLNNAQLQERIRPAFPDEDSYQAFMSALDVEDTFTETVSTVLRGSPTQPRGAFGAEQAMLAGDVATGGTGAAIGNMVRSFLGTQKGIPEATRTEIAKLLMRDASKGVLSPQTIAKLQKSKVSLQKANEFMRGLKGGMITYSGEVGPANLPSR